MNDPTLIGWREWLALPELGLPAIKAKIDTGATTSALHTFGIERFRRQQQDWIKFYMHPLQRNESIVIACEAPLLEERIVSDSGGHRERRPVIVTLLQLGEQQWPIELTLTQRDSMLFRMLLGRQAMKDRLLVDPSHSYLCGLKKARACYKKLSLPPTMDN